MTSKKFGLSQATIGNVDMCKLSIAFACIATVALKNWGYIVYAAQAFMILMVFSKCVRARRIPSIGLYAAAYGFFACWCLTSTFWAANPSETLSAFVGIVQFVVLGGCIAVYVRLEQNADFLISCLAWASFALVVVLVFATPLSAWVESAGAMEDAASDSNRIGPSVGYHPNALGHTCAVGVVIWLYKYMKSGRRAVNLLPAVLMCATIIFTKLRLSIVVTAACLVLYWFLISKGFLRKVIVLTVLLLVSVLVFWALLNVPMLYQIVGFRFEAMLGLSGSVDASTETRSEMIAIALELFSGNPITGIGFANYSYYYFYDYGGWAMTYAHSNYAELLAGLGLPGVIAYYAVPVWTLYALIKNRKSATSREMHALLIAFGVCFLIADYSSISYTNDYVQILWAVSYAYALGLKRSNPILSNEANRVMGVARNEGSFVFGSKA